MAMRMGKHCFCQKPLAHSIYEARLIAQVAKEQKVATQMGNQGTADNELRRAAAVVRSGVLGAVKEVHVWTNRPWVDQGIRRPAPKPCPAHLKWDLWLSAAPRGPLPTVIIRVAGGPGGTSAAAPWAIWLAIR